MGTRTVLSMVAMGAVLLAASLCWAVPSLDPISGHYYELNTAGTTWDQARVNSAASVFGGVNGHLATVGDYNENQVVRYIGGTGDRWVGLTDATGISTLDGFDPVASLGTSEQGNTSGLPLPAPGVEPVLGERGFGWKWIDGTPLTFQPWNGGEPNDSGGEDGLQLTGGGTWNDNKAGTTIGETGGATFNYAVEYDALEHKALDGQGRADILERRGVSAVTNLAQAKAMLALPDGDAGIAAQGNAQAFAVSFHDPENDGGHNEVVKHPFLTDNVFTGGAATDDNNIAFQATGVVRIPSSGDWSFSVAHDDEFELNVGANSFTSPGCCGDDVAVFNLAAGDYPLSLFWVENGGGAYVQLFAAQGNLAAFDINQFTLVGDELNGGLHWASNVFAVVPEPMTAMLGLMGLGALAMRRRRTA